MKMNKFKVRDNGDLFIDMEELKSLTIKEVFQKLPDNYLISEDMVHYLLAFCKKSDISCDIQEEYLPMYDAIIKPTTNE